MQLSSGTKKKALRPLLKLNANKIYSFYKDMTTIKLAVLKHTKAKDGSFKIRIAIGHKSETHYIVTRYRITTFANFKNGVVIGQPDANYINVKLRSLLNDYDTRLDAIPNLGDLTCEQLRNMLRDMPSTTASATFKQVADDYIKQLREEKRNTYAHLLEYSIKKFLEYTRGDILLSQITPVTIDGYAHVLRSQGASPAYQSIRLSNVRTIINRAIKQQLIRYDVHPFTYQHETAYEPRELDISVEEMRMMMEYQPRLRNQRKCFDMFKLSYLLGGMNLIDIIGYDFRNHNGIIRYQRKKTLNKKLSSSTTEFSIQPEALAIIERWMNPKTGHLADVKEKDYPSFLSGVHYNVKAAAKKLGITRRVSYYTARKSFVQHGFELGIPLETLEYCVGQTMKSNRPIFNYVRIMRQHADLAIRQIIDQLNEKEDATAPSNE